MDDKKNQVPYIVYESALATMERTIKRLWILCIILIVLLVSTNIAWIRYESSFTDVITTEITQEADSESGDAINVNGDYVNGQSKADSEDYQN